MADKPGTFGGTWTRHADNGRARDLREARDRASFDSQRQEGCAGVILIAATTLAGLAWTAVQLHPLA
jgi:hypothetical protein